MSERIKHVQLSDNDHIKLRLNMYLGTKKECLFNEWVVDKNTNKLKKVNISYSSAIYKAIDEIVVNAIDHYTRTKEMVKKYRCDVIKCDFNIETGEISVYNNGIGFEIKKFDDRDQYIPQVVFCELKTSSNFSDDDRITGGMNGFGSKLTNVLSDYFIIETVDEDNGLYYYQKIENGNETINEPVIQKTSKKGFTKITFKLNYTHCYEREYDVDIGNIIDTLLYTRMVNTSLFCKDTKVYYNDIEIKQKSFKDLLEFESINTVMIHNTDPSLNFDVSFVLSESSENFSLINGVYAKNGGTQIKFIEDLILSNLKDKIEKLFKGKKISSKSIFNSLFILTKGYIKNPEFVGQEKNELKMNKTSFKGYSIDSSVYTKIWKMIKDNLESLYVLSERKVLSSTDGKKKKTVMLEKLFDAEMAGTKNSKKCTLILTEGDSARATAISGLSKIGRKHYGIFPLRGKFLNVRDASAEKVNNNEEFKHIKEIIGLKNNFTYTSLDELRYGSIMCMTDADSVSGDTPILVRNSNSGHVFLIEIQHLHKKGCTQYIKSFFKQKQYCTILNMEVWTEDGWTEIKHIMKHKVSKKMYRVGCDKGFIDVTEDHSLLEVKNNKILEIKPENINQNTVLLNNDYNFQDVGYNYFFNKESELYLYGIFYHYGYIVGNTLIINLKHENVFSSSLELFKSLHPDVVINKILKSNSYSIIIVDKRVVNRFRFLFYYTEKKKFIHPYILFNVDDSKRLEFLNGYFIYENYRNDEDSLNSYNKEKYIITESNKISIQSFYILLKNIQGLENIQFGYNDCFDVYEIYINYTKRIYDVKIMQLQKNKELYVYDIETTNHHFGAGIGSLIVHNTDGIHIRGLILNMISTFWPELIEFGFMTSMMTPIVRVNKSSEKLSKNAINFYSEHDYKNWLDTTNNTSSYKIKYYKGLGTITKDLAIELFSDLENLKIMYYADELTTESIKLGFDKKYADNRKKWILYYSPNDKKNHLDVKQKNVSITEYINKELIQFSHYDTHRSIPNVLDGFKPSQRKIIYTALKIMKPGKEYKVAQFGPEVAKLTEYHHGENSLFGAIINMAQDYVGSNNKNLLLPLGQFGSRLCNGSDHSAPRYIFTNLSPIAKKLFNEDDSNLLHYLTVENSKVEPKYYIPILPIILLNGSKGIGTGFSTNIYSYNIKDIIKVILDKIDGKKIKYEIDPYYEGFKGNIKYISDGHYEMTGCYELDENTIYITELPIGTSIDKYQSFLIDMEKNKKILSFTNKSTDNDILFEIIINQEFKKNSEIIKFFKLSEKLSTTNMYAFDSCSTMRKFDSAVDIISYHYKYRNSYYNKRKEYILKRFELQLLELKNKIRFIKCIISEEIEIRNKKKDFIVKKLIELEFDLLDGSFNYMLNMNLLSLTYEKVKDLENTINILETEYLEYKNKSIKTIWKEELNEILEIE